MRLKSEQTQSSGGEALVTSARLVHTPQDTEHYHASVAQAQSAKQVSNTTYSDGCVRIKKQTTLYTHLQSSQDPHLLLLLP
jgi:hypothetical protein